MAHHSTILSQWLKLVPRHEFEALAKRHHKGRKLRSMARWAQFAALALGQLWGRWGLRDVVASLAAQLRRLYHLGVGRVARSSLSRVGSEQPHELCEELFGRLLSRCQGGAQGHGFRFRNRLLSLDSTTIDLCLSMFPWAGFRRTKSAVKLHVGFAGVFAALEVLHLNQIAVAQLRVVGGHRFQADVRPARAPYGPLRRAGRSLSGD